MKQTINEPIAELEKPTQKAITTKVQNLTKPSNSKGVDQSSLAKPLQSIEIQTTGKAGGKSQLSDSVS